MKNYILILIMVGLVSGSCMGQSPAGESDLNSLVKAEKEFAKMSAEKGVKDAFLVFLADDAILFRPTPVEGKKFMTNRPAAPGLLTWTPIYAEISAAGDLGYTTGPWEYRRNGEADTGVAYGNYVTIWRKQQDGSWKVLIDVGDGNPQPKAATSALKTRVGKREGKVDVPVDSMDNLKTILLDIDNNFAKLSLEKSAAEAYQKYADDNIKFFRSESYPLNGKKATRDFLKSKIGIISWKPTKVELSKSGDLGFTYGTSGYKDTTSTVPTGYNSYLRIWRKQAKEGWKAILDIENPIPPATTPNKQ